MFRTLFNTAYPEDAGFAGFDRPAEPGFDGGFSVAYDDGCGLPSVTINGSDGEVQVVGLAAIEQLAWAVSQALKLARPAVREAA